MYLTKHPAVKNKICLCLSKLYISKIGKKLWLKCTSSKLDSDYQANCKVRNSLWRLTRNLRKDYEIKITQHAKSNPKIFWRYINSQLKVRLTINSLKKPDGTDTQDSSEIADVFNESFFTLSEKIIQFLSSIWTMKYHPSLTLTLMLILFTISLLV